MEVAAASWSIDARKNPDRLRIGMIPGASAQIFAAGFAKAADVKLIDVPFKGDNEGAVALAGGHIEVHVAVPVSYKALVEAKKVKILAVAAEARSPLYGNLPTFRENGVDLVIGAFHGVYVPKATPPAIVSKLADALEKTMTTPELVSNMNDVGAGIVFLRGQPAKDFLGPAGYDLQDDHRKSRAESGSGALIRNCAVPSRRVPGSRIVTPDVAEELFLASSRQHAAHLARGYFLHRTELSGQVVQLCGLLQGEGSDACVLDRVATYDGAVILAARARSLHRSRRAPSARAPAYRAGGRNREWAPRERRSHPDCRPEEC